MEDPNEWLEYEGRKAPVYYLCGYIPGSIGADILSEKIIRFKDGHYPNIKFWLNSAFNTLSTILKQDDTDLLTRALSHHELKVDLYKDYKTPLGYLCTRLARLLKSRYAAGMIYKLNPNPPLKSLTKEERWNLIRDNFKVADGFNRRQFKQFWFVDDVITTGATARAVWKALLEFYPDIDFRVFALARTVRDHDFNNDLHILEDWNRIKDIEDLVIYEPSTEYQASPNSGFALPSVEFDNSDTFFALR